MQPWVKVCGIKDLETALLLEELGFDALGFNFYPRSKRYITPEEAASISKNLQKIKKVGVFVNSTAEEILEIREQVGLHLIQLHGNEPPRLIEELPAGSVIKYLPATPDLHRNVSIYSRLDIFALLIDTPTRNYGGSGRSFNWEDFTFLRHTEKPIIVAGGLNPDNFCDAIRILSPFGLDFNSGLEKSPGTKDPSKLRLLAKRLKEESCSS